MSGVEFGSGDVKINYYNHHREYANWADRIIIRGLAYSDNQLTISTNPVEGQDRLQLQIQNYRPGVTDVVESPNVGINVGKKPRFTITFTDAAGLSVTTGIFTVEGPNGAMLE